MQARWIWLCGAVAALAMAISCGDSEATPGGGASGGSGGSGAAGGTITASGGTGGGFNFGGQGPYEDFPASPIVDDGLPSDIADQFAAGASEPSGGPCLQEPTLDAMVPGNWTPLLFEWSAPAELTVFELQLEVDNQVNPLLIYTANPAHTIDASIWAALTSHSGGEDIHIRVRGAGFDGASLTTAVRTGSEGDIHLAPVDAPGSVVYWTASSGSSFQGFNIGDLTSTVILTPASAGVTSTGGNTTCVSCHVSSPDGELLIYSRDADDGTRAIDIRRIDGTPLAPGTVSSSALALLGRHKQTAPITSQAHYGGGDAVVISVMSDPNLNGGRYELIWTDLHAADLNGWGVLDRGTEILNVSSPAWRRDGTAVAYVASAGGGEGVIAGSANGDDTMDIYVVPYNDKAGGQAVKLAGASDASLREFYPQYSPDDVLLAFNRTDQPVDSYDEPTAEVYVVPADGGAATRLRANDPPACGGQTSPGLTNSWARWAPEAKQDGDLRYYWLVFSSKRRGHPQLYISALVTDVSGASEVLVADYPALYVTAQDPLGNNHTPVWDVIDIDEVQPPQ